MVAYVFRDYTKSIMKQSNENNQQRPADRGSDAQKPENEPVRSRENHPEGLRPEDLPEADNENTGSMGSGQRQDSN